jgi:hypothetical protein
VAWAVYVRDQISTPIVSDSQSPFSSNQAAGIALGPRDAIAQSVEARESSRLQRLHRTLTALLNTTRVNPPTSAPAFDQLLGSILDAVMIASEAHKGNLQLVDPDTDSLRIRVHRGFSQEFLRFFNAVQHDSFVCGTSFARGTPVVVEDVDASGLFEGDSLALMKAANINAVQSLALIHQGRKLGVISVHYHFRGIPLRSREMFASTSTLIAEIVAAAQ